ncbi:MAG TPA: hypothetical protein VFA17_09550 [Thermoplasmata archaeon]|jgi:hypothetical protein|nr:hypothetical protein [Thermoplasmata archaeon]
MKEGSVEEAIPREGLGAGVTFFTRPSPSSTVPRIDYERIFVLDDAGALIGEYVLRDDCPLEFEDLRRGIPAAGLRHLVTFFQGEYAFTPFRVENLWFVILTHGVPRIEERGSIGTLLAAMRVHLPLSLPTAYMMHELQIRERARELDGRETDLTRREERVARLEAELKVAARRLKEWETEVQTREMRLATLRDYAIQMQRAFRRSASPSDAAPSKESASSTRASGPSPP